MENSTLNSTVCKLAEERQRMIAYIIDPWINHILDISDQSVEGLKSCVTNLSDQAIEQIYIDLSDAYEEKNADYSQDPYERYREDSPFHQ
jgi:hypothetical protein